MRQSKGKLSPWNSRKQQTKGRVPRTGDNYGNYQHSPMPVCPGEAELQGCAITMLSAIQPPVLPAALKRSSAISENWMSSCLRSVTLEYLWSISCSWLSSSWQQQTTPCSSIRKQNWKATMFQLDKLSSNFYSYRWEDKLLWVQIIFQNKILTKYQYIIFILQSTIPLQAITYSL